MSSRMPGRDSRFVEMAAVNLRARGGFAPLGGGRSSSGGADFRPFHAVGSEPEPSQEPGDFSRGDDLLSGDDDSGALLDSVMPMAETALGDGDITLSGEDSALLGGDDSALLGGEEPALLGGEDTDLLGDDGTGLMGGYDSALLEGDGSAPIGEGNPLSAESSMFEEMPGPADDRSAPDEDDEIAILAAQHQRELEAVRSEFGETVAERISVGLKALEQQLLDGIATEVAQILAPILGEQARASSVAAFVEALRGALAEPGAVSISVEGPADLLAQVEKALEGNNGRLEFKEADQTDLRARLGDSVITTRLGEWAAELAGAVHE